MLNNITKPLENETTYDGKKIIELVEIDEDDDYQPYQYMLEDGSLVWIPVIQSED